MKHEWRKSEKAIYLPKNKPAFIDVPAFQFLTIEGAGNPNDPKFSDFIQVLYAVSYAIKMTLKKSSDAHDYTVYPLEGIWDITDQAKKSYDGTLNKDELVFKLMIRQPDFVSKQFAHEMIALTTKNKQLPLLDKVRFEKIKDGASVQMMHLGSYDNEPASFALMESFAKDNNLTRLTKIHREIYLSDVRKVPPEKLKTVLRFGVK